jgi:hypothetical protein
MLSTKLPTTIATLVASLSIAAVAAVPTVAQAAAKETQAEKKASCESDFKGFEASVNRMESALKEGNSANFNDAKVTAENFLTRYENSGCDAVLSRKLPPLPTHVVVLPQIYKSSYGPTRLA